MGDVWAKVTEATEETQGMLADAMVQRGEDPVFVGLRQQYLGWLTSMPGSSVVEMGCGPGDVTRALLDQIEAGKGIGIDPSPVMIERARERHRDEPRLTFLAQDARETDLETGSVDLILFHTALCHIPNPERALAEAARLLRPGGQLVIFDGDYATTTADLGSHDPVGMVVDFAIDQLVHDKYFCRSLTALVEAAEFDITRREVLPYLACGDAALFQSFLNRGCIFLSEAGVMDVDGLAAIKAEALARIASGRFFGFTAFHAMIAVKRT